MISEAIIDKYGYKEGLCTTEGKITAWPYDAPKPRASTVTKLIEEYKAKYQYIEDRKREYPPVEDQLDIIFHSGLDQWKLEIQAIKDKYPKP